MTPPYTATDLVLIIGVLTTSVVTIINAISGSRGRAALSVKADDATFAAKRAEGAASQMAEAATQHALAADTKLDHITVLANSTLQAALKRIAELEILVNDLVAANAGTP